MLHYNRLKHNIAYAGRSKLLVKKDRKPATKDYSSIEGTEKEYM